ncbi:hypothetical protein [Streptomyces sp. NPDC049906]|uniref:hypothetical protein n=1 Tax=Streptomyces sp. NPDC049906 TaxID=3155656 RepID=UPI0034449664
MLLGLIGPAAGKWDNDFCAILSLIFSSGWPWGCYAFAVGYCCRSKIESALLASVGLSVGVVAYYAFKDLNPAVPIGEEYVTSSGGPSSMILLWGIFALVLGAPVGVIGNLARMQGFAGLPFRVIAPLIALCETTMRLDVESDGQPPAVIVTWQVVRFAAGVMILALGGHAIWASLRRRRNRSLA